MAKSKTASLEKLLTMLKRNPRIKYLAKKMTPHLVLNLKVSEKEITTAFFTALANRSGSLRDDVQRTIIDQYKAKAQTIGTSAEGGILVPITVDQNIQQQLDRISPMRQIARAISNAPAHLQLLLRVAVTLTRLPKLRLSQR